MSSQRNGGSADTINSYSNHRMNGVSNDEYENDWEGLEELQHLIPEIQDSFTLISKQFTEFLSYTKHLERLASKFELMQRKQEEVEREMEQLKKDQGNVEQQMAINADDRVYLDIGGQRFTTTVKTLTQNNSIFFKTLINSNKKSSSEDPIFIDRDGRLFEYVLKYLRNGELDVEDKAIRKDLLTEARYYKLQSLEEKLNVSSKKEDLLMTANVCDNANQSPPSSPVPTNTPMRVRSYSPTVFTNNAFRASPSNQASLVKPKPHPAQTASSWRSVAPVETQLTFFRESNLLTTEYEQKLVEFLASDIPRQAWRLIYRATEHGFDAADFHRCCDTHTPTISIIQSDTGNIFGGFTRVAWSSALLRTDQADPTAFLFTLKNTLNISPTKCPVAQEHQHSAISHNPTCGPNFGSPKNEGSDLCLRTKFNEKTNCIFFPKSYMDPTNQGSILFAKKYFACREVEVFTLTNNI